MRVVVEEYNPQWALQFQKVKQDLEATLDGIPYISIEHVGSTSVPGLVAKPIIDVDIIVTQQQLAHIRHSLTERGGYVDLGDMGIPERYAFRRQDAKPTRNLYVCIVGSQGLLNHLAVRDLCRRDPQVRATYAAKKLELAEKDWPAVDDYCEAKNDVLEWVLEQSGVRSEVREEIRKHNTSAGTLG
jgi:GrpB-like predicted nucleotidyltransferase (UPF0157 family)